MLKKRKLGRTGLLVTEIGLGTNYIGQLDPSKKDDGVRTVIRALERGINFIDTAPMYGNGFAEEVVGIALQGRKDKPYISAKVGYMPDNNLSWSARHQYDKSACWKVLEGSLKRLEVDRVNLVMIHDADRMGPPDALTGKGMALEAVLEMKEQGLCDGIGVGCLYTHAQMELVRQDLIDALLSFHRFDLVWKDAETLFRIAHKNNIAVIAGAPFHQGWLVAPRPDIRQKPPQGVSGHELDAIENIYRLSGEVNMPLTEMGLRFLLGFKEISVVIPGAQNPEQMELNFLASQKGALPEDLIDRIEKNRVVHSDPKNYV